MRRSCFFIPAFILFGVVVPSAHAADRFPFVIPGDDATATITDFSAMSPKPAGADGFVRSKDGHFATDSGRLRIWGMNLCFGANFPTKEEADKTAAHLAKLGVNGVRIHHHETSFSPDGLFNADGSWDAAQVDRLDYFLAKLHEHGIYANLNLHVGRAVCKLRGWPQLGAQHFVMADKHPLHFQPEIQEAFWQFCREFLGHVNPYRKLRRADDPAVAMIEIANENSFSTAGPSFILKAPEPYRSTLIRQWNAWLKEKHRSTDGLRAAWAPRQNLEPKVIVSSADWSKPNLGGWQTNDYGGQLPIRAVAQNYGSTLRIEFQQKAEQGWHQQLTVLLPSVVQGANYRLRFQARADRTRTCGYNVAIAPDGKWESLGLVNGFEATPEWKTFEFSFQCTKTVQHLARLTFDLGGDNSALEFRDLELKQLGSGIVVPEGQSLETASIAMPDSDWCAPAQSDFAAFMVDLERNFYRRTMDLLKKEIGVKVPVTTTQANFQPLSIIAEIADYADLHAYWHHPVFPGSEWDPNNWTVQHESLVPFPMGNQWPRVNLPMMSALRVRGKPFTCSEWNAADPNFFAADAVPVAALTAALQDWDAVFFFDYHSRGGAWNTDAMQGFFSFNGHPVKLALVSSLANLYRRGDLAPLAQPAFAATDRQQQTGPLAYSRRLSSDLELPPEQTYPVPAELANANKAATPDQSVVWDASNPLTAHVEIRTPKTICVWGMVGGKTIQVGPWTLAFGPCERNYAVFVATSRDHKPLAESSSILITLTGSVENQQMGWNADHTSVGNSWGSGPAQVNGIPLDMTIKQSAGKWSLFPLDGTGARQQPLPLADGVLSERKYQLGPQSKTLWYELSRTAE